MRKLIFILFCLISLISKGQVYQEMPQYGYRANRMAFDSTLQIPTTCGVPTLKSNVLKKSAIAFDSCNNKFYKYNPKTSAWSEVTGGIDTSSLSNRINSKADTSALNLKLNISDTSNKWVNSITKINDSTLNIIKGTSNSNLTITGVDYANKLKTSVWNNSGSTITKGSVIYINGAHSSNLPTIALAKANSESTSAYTYALVEDDIANNSSGTVIQNGKISNLNLPTSTYTDGQTLYLSPSIAGGYTLIKPTAPNHYVAIGTITRAHPVYGSIQVAIRNGFQLDEMSDVSIAAVPADSTLLQFRRVDSLWHDVSVTNAIGSKYIKPSDTASMLSPYQRSINAVKTSDTASMLSPYLRKTDTSTLSSRINLKVNISDTALMLSPYLRKVDTSTLSSRINLKINISDTSSMLSPYLRKIDTATLSSRINAKQDALNFSTGLTNTSGTITSNISTGVSGGQTIIGGTGASNSLTLSSTSNASKGKLIFGTNSAYDQSNDRIGLGTTSPSNKFDVISGSAGTMTRNQYETGSFVSSGDIKVGIYTASSNSTHGAALSFAQTNLTANSRYPGFDMQYVYSSTVASNAWRLNYTERSSAGLVQNYTANIFQAYADGSVIINPTTSGVTASAKLLVGTSTNAGYMLDVNGTARATQFYLSALNTAPASASATGTTGEIRIDANYIYICTATNTWKRVAISTW